MFIVNCNTCSDTDENGAHEGEVSNPDRRIRECKKTGVASQRIQVSQAKDSAVCKGSAA